MTQFSKFSGNLEINSKVTSQDRSQHITSTPTSSASSSMRRQSRQKAKINGSSGDSGHGESSDNSICSSSPVAGDPKGRSSDLISRSNVIFVESMLTDRQTDRQTDKNISIFRTSGPHSRPPLRRGQDAGLPGLMTSDSKQRPELVTSSVDDSAENSSTSSMDSSSFAAAGSPFARQVGGRHHHHHLDRDRLPFRQPR